MISFLGLNPQSYQPSALHSPDRVFRETNCYVDLWIELLNGLGIDAASAMAFTCALDFEGDQWTFFKPPSQDLRRLYGVDVHEMQLYRPTVDHVVEQLSAGQTIVMEADAFYMPDRAATSYRTDHVKSSIAIEAIDPETERLRYFHGPGYYELSGEDYRGVFRLGRCFSDDVLPPYVEVVRFVHEPRLDGGELRCVAHGLLAEHLAYRPQGNPWRAFGDRLVQDLPLLLAGNGAACHAYSFATIRQCGAAFECAKSFVEWLADRQCAPAIAAADAFDRQVADCKVLLLKLARRRLFDPAPIIENLAASWEIAMTALGRLTLETRFAVS